MPRVTDFLPIPNLEEAHTILCVQPHPDDAEVGAGATLARLARAGARITYVTVTDGGMGTPDPGILPAELARTRRAEQEAAAAIIGVTELIWLDYPDDTAVPLVDLRLRLGRIIREVKPDAVLTVDPWLSYEAHPDHRTTGLAAVEAAVFSEFPGFGRNQGLGSLLPHRVKMVGLFGTARPNTWIGVDETWACKIAALACHTSQFPAPILAQYAAYFEARARELASGRGCQLAEAFKVLSPVHLHFNVEAAEC